MISFVQDLLVDFPRLALVIQLSIIVISSTIILIFLSLIIMVFHRYRKHKKEKREVELIPILDHLIYQFVFFANLQNSRKEKEFVNQEEIINEIHHSIHNRRDKQLFINRLVGLKKAIGGDINKEIRELIYNLNLERFLLRKLSKFKNYKKVQGLSELAILDLPAADVYIIPLTHARSRAVRITARNTYVKLSNNNPFNFFDSNDEELLVWEQIELFNIITTNEHLTVPNFSSWISNSKNKSLIKFCLELVAFYNQLEALPSVKKLLDSEHIDIRIAAIKCLGKMKIQEAESKLVQIYLEQTREGQLEILESLGQISTGRYIDFLINEFRHGSEFSIRKKAAKAIINNSENEPEIIDDLLLEPTNEQEIMLHHYLNPLTKSA